MTLPIKQFGIAVTAALALAVSASAQGAAKPAQSTGKPTTSVTTAREASTGMATGRREAQTGQASGAQSSAKDSAQPATSADAAKPSGDKKDVGFPACDGASKDAAKCVAAPPAPGAAAKHVNKVEAISIMQ
jgi:hypothetical protein